MSMEGLTAAAQTLTFGQALLTGVCMGIYYDVFRIIRRFFQFGYATIVAQDVFFWVTSAAGVFFVMIWFSGGIVRIYFLLAVLCGWLLYALTLGALLMYIIDRVIWLLRKAYRYIYKKAVMPIVGKVKIYAKKLVLERKNLKKIENSKNSA